MTEHAVDRHTNLAHRIFAVLREKERSGRRFLYRECIERHQIVDMHVRPDVLAGSGMGRATSFSGKADEQGHLHAVRRSAVTEAVDQARADDDRAASLVAV